MPSAKKYSLVPAKRQKLMTMVKPTLRRSLSRYSPARVFAGKQAIPPQYFATLTYGKRVSVNTNASGRYVQVFVANGMTIPDASLGFTTTQPQPLYFKQLMAMYDHYSVLKSTITIQGHNIVTTELVPALTDSCSVVLSIGDDVQPPTTYGEHLARPGAVNNIWDPEGGWYPKITKVYNSGRTFGRNTPIDPTLRGNAVENPEELTTFFIFFECANNSVATNILFDVVIKYEVVFTELRNVDASQFVLPP